MVLELPQKNHEPSKSCQISRLYRPTPAVYLPPELQLIKHKFVLRFYYREYSYVTSTMLLTWTISPAGVRPFPSIPLDPHTTYDLNQTSITLNGDERPNNSLSIQSFS